mmetsp:Transcript_15166/g.19801  ORF Transcript_15166/g.19801 Transcript_15166/m.19801 type:complete len:199 (-) Transcript_15166:200-796(-)|eukprot:CAMPEP_0116065674 /NCGR_PEP_ID=MMETSP0322-20121206/9918_1 /TAXON_ID=163516 /ORGANISM="Leptocylindrus danicus var. apora, Strain B651" /LENGTH=198 /DNA_ID=CAMNT_0003552063 /DNA_START=22 /DNA_END=618 /DNA_ORIENTATION=+
MGEISYQSTGLTHAQADVNREEDGCLNIIDPPIKCPSWACIILPCIKRIPSIALFSKIEPTEAEVLRESEWMVYDVQSVVRGDILKLAEDDLVPADCRVVEVLDDEVVVDMGNVTGESKPRVVTKSNIGSDVEFCYGARVLAGSCVVVVTAIGPNTTLAKLMKSKKWPPADRTKTGDGKTYEIVSMDDNEGISSNQIQ